MKVKIFKRLCCKIKNFLYSYRMILLKDFLFAAIVISGVVTLFAGITLITHGLLTSAFSHHFFYLYAGITGMFIGSNTILYLLTEKKPKPYLQHHSVSFEVPEEERVVMILRKALSQKSTFRRKSLQVRSIEAKNPDQKTHSA